MTCSTGGATKFVFPSIEPGNSYYLVVPLSAEGVEGSFGVDSLGRERPPAYLEPLNPQDPATCGPQFVSDTCDPGP